MGNQFCEYAEHSTMRRGQFPKLFKCIACAVLCLLPLLALAVPGQAGSEDHLKSLIQRAFDLHQRGQFAQARPLLERAYKMDPDDYFVNLLLGIDFLRTGDPKAANLYLRKASACGRKRTIRSPI